LLSSDRHWDNPKSDHALQLKHLKEAKAMKAGILDNGDFLCLMQGKFDRRSNKKDIRPEHNTDNYLDAVIETAADFFAPYAHNFICIASGNHEASIRERYETNMTDRLVSALNITTGSHIYPGTFSGWVIFNFKDINTTRNIVLHYDHGYGGGGPVTKDMIQHSRRAMYLPDADIVLSGHTHDQWVAAFERMRLNAQTGQLSKSTQWHIKLPTYKDDYGIGSGGWATAAKGMPPKPLGAWWLEFYYDPVSTAVKLRTIQAD